LRTACFGLLFCFRARTWFIPRLLKAEKGVVRRGLAYFGALHKRHRSLAHQKP
jgi:hypothetical protein